jgi:hypothetical protein
LNFKPKSNFSGEQQWWQLWVVYHAFSGQQRGLAKGTQTWGNMQGWTQKWNDEDYFVLLKIWNITYFKRYFPKINAKHFYLWLDLCTSVSKLLFKSHVADHQPASIRTVCGAWWFTFTLVSSEQHLVHLQWHCPTSSRPIPPELCHYQEREMETSVNTFWSRQEETPI